MEEVHTRLAGESFCQFDLCVVGVAASGGQPEQIVEVGQALDLPKPAPELAADRIPLQVPGGVLAELADALVVAEPLDEQRRDLLGKAESGGRRVVEAEDLSSLFGIEMAEDLAIPVEKPKRGRPKGSVAKKKAGKAASGGESSSGKARKKTSVERPGVGRPKVSGPKKTVGKATRSGKPSATKARKGTAAEKAGLGRVKAAASRAQPTRRFHSPSECIDPSLLEELWVHVDPVVR